MSLQAVPPLRNIESLSGDDSRGSTGWSDTRAAAFRAEPDVGQLRALVEGHGVTPSAGDRLGLRPA